MAGQLNVHFPCEYCGEMIYVDAFQVVLDGAKQGKCPACGRTIDMSRESVSEPDEDGGE